MSRKYKLLEEKNGVCHKEALSINQNIDQSNHFQLE